MKLRTFLYHLVKKSRGKEFIPRFDLYQLIFPDYKEDLRHELYKKSLFERKEMKHTQVAIRSHNHQIGVYEQNKTSLSPVDTKKWIAPDGITTRAYGHYKIQEDDDLEQENWLNDELAADPAVAQYQ